MRRGMRCPKLVPTMSETEVAMSSIMMSSSVLAGCIMAAKYSVMLGELHLARTETSCKKQLLNCRLCMKP